MRLRKAFITLIVGMVAGASLSPLLAGLLVCTDGTVPDCCPKVDLEAAASAWRATVSDPCDCCVELDAVPPTVGNSTQKRLLDVQVTLTDVAIVVAPPAAPVALESTDDERDNSPSSARSAILRL